MTKKQKPNLVLIIVALAVLGLGLTVYSLLPTLSGFRTSIYGQIVILVATAGIMVYLTLAKSINMPTLGKITVWGYLVLQIIFRIINWGKTEAVFFLLYGIINIAVTVYLYKTTKKVYASIWAFGALSYLSTVTFAQRAHLIEDDSWMLSTIPSIIFGAITLIICVVYSIKKYKPIGDKEKLISIPIIGLIAGFLFSFLTISSMNVYLDTSIPTYEEFVIIDKDVSTGAKSNTTYKLEVQNENTTFTINVSEKTFYDYETNDTITLSIYSGAFNEPYYIYDNN